jgi:hypothetical protein
MMNALIAAMIAVSSASALSPCAYVYARRKTIAVTIAMIRKKGASYCPSQPLV